VFRLERLEHLAEKFKQKCNFYDEWSSGKEKLLESNDYKTTNMHSLKCLQKKHEFFETEMANHQERVEQIVEIAKELARLRYPNQQAINHQCGEICENWKTLADLVKKRRNALIEMEKVLEKLDDLHLKFAHLANPFNNWVSSTREDLLDIVIVTEMNEVERLLVDHNTFKDTLPDADNSLKEIIDLDQVNNQILLKNRC
jgi:actinin alpha